MNKYLIGVFALLALLLVAAALTAAPTKEVKRTAVTVALSGVECPRCAQKLQGALAKVNGATAVKATFKPAQVTAQIDEKTITASQFAARVASELQAIEPKSKTDAKLQVFIDSPKCKGEAKMCQGCFTEIPKALKSVKGVQAVTLDETGKIATITFAKGAKVSTAALTNALQKSPMQYTAQFTAPAAAKAAAADDCCAPKQEATGGAACH